MLPEPSSPVGWRRSQLLAVVVLSACVGLIGGAAAAWTLYHRLEPVQRIVAQPLPGGSGGGATLGGIAADRSPSVVSILTRPATAESLAAGPAGFVNGFVAGADGLVVTSARGLEGATRLRVALGDGHAYDALVAATDRRHGVVVLRAVGAHDLTPLSFAARPPRPGDFALVVARPPLQSVSVTAGTVSAAGRAVAAGSGAPLTDAVALAVAGDDGDEGAPLLDDRGAVIGVTTLDAAAPGSPPELAGLSGRAAAALVDRVARGAVRPPALGIEAVVLDPAAAAAAGLPPGGLVRSVSPDGPAAAAGLVGGDIITAVDGVAVDLDHPLDPLALRLEAGQRITLSVVTAGHSRNVSLTVGGE